MSTIHTVVFEWEFKGSFFDVPYNVSGQGPQMLFLPTMNVSSCRTDLRKLTKLFSKRYQTFTPDWPGFGESSRLNCQYTPDVYMTFLNDFLIEIIGKREIPVVACGHAAGYVLNLLNADERQRINRSGGKTNRKLFSKIAIVSPTWLTNVSKGMGIKSSVNSMYRTVMRAPVVGDMLYKIACQPGYLRSQYETNVFKEKDFVTDEYIEEKAELANRTGGKFAPSSFFTGILDTVKDRSEIKDWIENSPCPIIMVYGEDSPEKQLCEMIAISKEASNLKSTAIPGSLGVAEEFPEDVAEAILPFFVE